MSEADSAEAKQEVENGGAEKAAPEADAAGEAEPADDAADFAEFDAIAAEFDDVEGAFAAAGEGEGNAGEAAVSDDEDDFVVRGKSRKSKGGAEKEKEKEETKKAREERKRLKEEQRRVAKEQRDKLRDERRQQTQQKKADRDATRTKETVNRQVQESVMKSGITLADVFHTPTAVQRPVPPAAPIPALPSPTPADGSEGSNSPALSRVDTLPTLPAASPTQAWATQDPPLFDATQETPAASSPQQPVVPRRRTASILQRQATLSQSIELSLPEACATPPAGTPVVVAPTATRMNRTASLAMMTAGRQGSGASGGGPAGSQATLVAPVIVDPDAPAVVTQAELNSDDDSSDLELELVDEVDTATDGLSRLRSAEGSGLSAEAAEVLIEEDSAEADLKALEETKRRIQTRNELMQFRQVSSAHVKFDVELSQSQEVSDMMDRSGSVTEASATLGNSSAGMLSMPISSFTSRKRLMRSTSLSIGESLSELKKQSAKDTSSHLMFQGEDSSSNLEGGAPLTVKSLKQAASRANKSVQSAAALKDILSGGGSGGSSGPPDKKRRLG